MPVLAVIVHFFVLMVPDFPLFQITGVREEKWKEYLVKFMLSKPSQSQAFKELCLNLVKLLIIVVDCPLPSTGTVQSEPN